uniref:Uncharacterized protein n=1 Tax=Romanomermis culicivorax TaxID=13658 RepID=A0A915JJY3_ROMCU
MHISNVLNIDYKSDPDMHGKNFPGESLDFLSRGKKTSLSCDYRTYEKNLKDSELGVSNSPPLSFASRFFFPVPDK